VISVLWCKQGGRTGSRPRTVAFEGVSFEIGHGEVFGFLGPNGAGIAISARSNDTRVAQQLGTLASLPSIAVICS
jgi:ABC-type Na+ transport system ATPase subunit NatA